MLVFLVMTPTVAAADSIFLSCSLAELVNRETQLKTDPVVAV